jgi:hypothetical protein
VTIYEILPDRRTRERSMPGCAAADPMAVEELCERLLAAAKQGECLEAVLGEQQPTMRRPSTTPCWPEICEAVVAFQRGQGVNMNLVGPFKGSGYFRLLPADRPATVEDVRRFALHTGESLKAHLEDASEPLLPMATHRQGFRQKREVVSLLRRAGFAAIAPEELSSELKGMVNHKKQALVAAGQSRRRIPSTEAIEDWLDAVMAEDPLWGWVFAMVATYGLRPHEVWHIDGLPDGNGLITVGVAARENFQSSHGPRQACSHPQRPVQLTRHAQDKLVTYGIEGARLASWRAALLGAESFLDASTGGLELLMEWEERPWVVILREDGETVVTTYPRDARTVMSRRGGGRWIFRST